jgi:hypothetical protein
MEFKLYKSRINTAFSSFYILSNEQGSLWFDRNSNGNVLYVPGEFSVVVLEEKTYLTPNLTYFMFGL